MWLLASRIDGRGGGGGARRRHTWGHGEGAEGRDGSPRADAPRKAQAMTRNIEMLVRAARAPGDLRGEVVFVGGVVWARGAAPGTRVPGDQREGAPLCRWCFGDLAIDGDAGPSSACWGSRTGGTGWRGSSGRSGNSREVFGYASSSHRSSSRRRWRRFGLAVAVTLWRATTSSS